MGSMSKIMDKRGEEPVVEQHETTPEDAATASENETVASQEFEGGTPVDEDAEGVEQSVDQAPEGATATEDSFEAAEGDEGAAALAEDEQLAVDPALFDTADVDEPADAETPPEQPAPVSNFHASKASVVAAAVTDEIVNWDPQRVDPAVIAYHNRFAAIVEQYRSLRARVLSLSSKQQYRVLVITSSVPEEGKSVTTVNLAIAMAEGGDQRIVVADADFRRASLARMLGIEGEPGLAEVLAGRATLEEVIRPTPYPNLKVIPAGKVGASGYADLLSAARVQETFAQLRKAFSFCLLDTPPVTTVSDVSLLAPHCDGAFMVIEMGRTPEPTVQLAVRALQTTRLEVLGCILSRHGQQHKYYYDRYRGYYYHRQPT